MKVRIIELRFGSYG